MTHTPGPWEVHGDTTSELFYVHGANTICDIRRGAYSEFGDPRFSRTPREDETNARLIAAAPELLAKLQTMVAVFNVPDIDPLQAFAAIEQAKHEIAKATGSA